MPNYTTYNIKMVKGDTESFGFELEGLENLDAAYFSCKRNSQDENYLFQKFLNSGITQKTENQYVVRIEPDDTALLEPGQYWYDLEISKNDDVFTIFRGVLELLPEITTPTGDININTSWGRITGNINNQEDLQLEFQTKADVSSLSTVATTGLYSDLTGTPNLATVATSGAYSDLTGTPNLATVATSGSYVDLSNKPNLATVATTGSYNDLSDKPTLSEPTVLYTSSSNTQVESFSISETIKNYSRIGCVYLVPEMRTYTNAVRGYREFFVDSSFSSQGLSFSTLCSRHSSSNVITLIFYTGFLIFNGLTATFYANANYQLTHGSSTIAINSQGIVVLKVLGYK